MLLTLQLQWMLTYGIETSLKNSSSKHTIFLMSTVQTLMMIKAELNIRRYFN